MALAVGFAWEYTEVTCGQCQLTWGMPDRFYRARINDHASFWCPNGHMRSFIGKTEADRLREQLAAEQRAHEQTRKSREWAESRAKGANIAAGKAKAAHRRVLERIHAGVCPHCQRTFQQLAAHMKSKHQDKVPAVPRRAAGEP